MEKRVGAPKGNTNALKHGYYAAEDLPDDLPEDAKIEHMIDILYRRQLHLDAYIDRREPEAGVQEISHLLRIFGHNASRLGRLLRDRRALSGNAADGISAAMAQALDELGTELGTDL